MENLLKFDENEIIELLNEDGSISTYRLMGADNSKEEDGYMYLRLQDEKGNESSVNILDLTEIRGAGQVMLIEITDDFDKHIKCKLGDITEYKGKNYIFLFNTEPDEYMAEDEAAVLELSVENNQMILYPVEDALMEEVYNFYMDEIDYEEYN